MGCNTSSEAKQAKEEKNDTQDNKNNAAAEDQIKKSDSKTEPSEEEAATKIQAVFRGHQTRKSMSMKAAKPQQQPQQQPQKPQQQPQKPQQQPQSKPEPEPTLAELEAEFRSDDKELCHAATKIQASFRGHQARKTQDAVDQAQKDKEAQEQQDKEDIENIDLADPDLNKAATKIQASFRGHKVRKDVPN